MSYSNTRKKTGNQMYHRSGYNNYEFNDEIQNTIGVIQSYTSKISRINSDEECSIENSEKVQELVQNGKIKIEEIQDKLKKYSRNIESLPQNEKIRMKLVMQKLSASYMKAVDNFQKASKNYINKTAINDMANKNNRRYRSEEYETYNNFSRKSNSNYDSNRDKLDVNIYDYNFYENEDSDTFYKNEQNFEHENLENGFSKKKNYNNRKYKNNIFLGNNKNDVNEHLLQNNEEYLENEKNEYYNDRQFVSINTTDIEHEILNQKNKEIKKLHGDIVNIQELYKELFDQVNIQGETIDNIDSQMVKTHDNIMISGREIEITRNRYSTSVRCISYLFIILIILVIIILVTFRII
ncbi:syntaxin, putative [Plasmodium berghei]|uniref:Syntaxin, putative n=2 Tax=Plasmodium berghei TaxID=5821 RepID=A0A509AKN2_PLABA|nr:syntaxin, putative [Plasmodium berghei ANKA]CXI46849.1 syntaxin, putative [Plasmodium berghei]SCM22836.1 syntaxin, putative [Plasmodium berghei]SCN25731.1 syntaxin, putative [Plasmodium berghei]SCO60643.1 syntaxin, putative [Plasmodium berghei]SCO62363.1 syntaxin, putative [Plasmodium berghei]|eukprot:XP_034421780.1 syntaxin, putative [Plasmodium berghei ANKA]